MYKQLKDYPKEEKKLQRNRRLIEQMNKLLEEEKMEKEMKK